MRASPGAAVKLCLGDLLVMGSNPETAIVKSLWAMGYEVFYTILYVILCVFIYILLTVVFFNFKYKIRNLDDLGS